VAVPLSVRSEVGDPFCERLLRASSAAPVEPEGGERGDAIVREPRRLPGLVGMLVRVLGGGDELVEAGVFASLHVDVAVLLQS